MLHCELLAVFILVGKQMTLCKLLSSSCCSPVPCVVVAAAGHRPTPGLLLLQLLVSLLVRSLALEQHSSSRWVSILAGLFDVACLPVRYANSLTNMSICV